MLKWFITVGLVFTGAFAMGDTFEVGWDRPGYDYSNFTLSNPREILCQWRCQKDTHCRAWTFVNPGVQGPLAHCWLKDRVPTAYKNSCCTSGIVSHFEQE